MIVEIPEAIMINVPETFFIDKGKYHPVFSKSDYEAGLYWFKQHYETMGTELNPEGLFYHFISSVPVHQRYMTHVYICFGGLVQYKAIVVEFIKQSNCADRGFRNYPVRDWVVTTGPVIKAPEGMVQKGFRGFRYCKNLF